MHILDSKTLQQKEIPQKEVKNEFDEILSFSGGFGRFQVMSSIVFVILFATTNHLFYALPLLVMYPKYDCSSIGLTSQQQCNHESYCNNKGSVTIDWTNTWSLENWVERYDLACIDPYQIALMGSMYFSGMCFFNILVTRLGDLYGRKWPVRISAILSLPIQAAIIWS